MFSPLVRGGQGQNPSLYRPDDPRRGIPSAPGWFAIPGSQFAPLCPEDKTIQGNTGCAAVASAWNGGVADTKRNHLVFFGGGHTDYGGNEIYAMDLNRLRTMRLTDPSPLANSDCAAETAPDGAPVARHTYGGVAYIAAADKIFLHGGGTFPCGLSVATWVFDPGTLKWTRKDPTQGTRIEPSCCNYINFSAYDNRTGKVYLFDGEKFWSYDYEANSYTLLATQPGVDYHVSAVLDEGRRLFLLIGNGQAWGVALEGPGKYHFVDLHTKLSACGALLKAAYPGLAYDSREKVIVGWAGGNSIYLFNPGAGNCREREYPGGPGPAQPNGTHGRFRYFPSLDVFALVNDWKQEAFLLRLGPADRQLEGKSKD